MKIIPLLVEPSMPLISIDITKRVIKLTSKKRDFLKGNINIKNEKLEALI